MARISGQTFRDQTVVLDGNAYDHCVFINCKIDYAGTTDPQLEHNTFDGCSWSFSGAASRTVDFLRALYATGDPEFLRLVDGTIDQIRGSTTLPRAADGFNA